MRQIAMVVFDQLQPLDLVGPFEAFATANALLEARGKEPAYRRFVLSPGGTAVRSESGLGLLVDGKLERPPSALGKRFDTLMVCGGLGARRAWKQPRDLRAVARLAARARRVTSVCTGSFVLAAAGLLDGKRATTHWQHCSQLARHFPNVQVEAEPIYVRDGRCWTSAGVTAGIDLALALIEEDLDRELASEVARQLVVFVRRAGGQAQFSAQLSVQSAERAPLRELMTWVVDHPEAALDVPSLAERAHMSVRHFGRLFRAETGVSPAAYVERVRVETARRLLETSARSIEEIAEQAGFGTPEALRRAFARRLSLSPREYRARFGEAV
ncbi:MAG TPA: GlxA family transcriptional regulator [Polyangiales bacterium]|nr:GlxA family transcriptional regulator [Polyangiales bacterium]